MTYEVPIKRPTQIDELKLNKRLDENPQLINSLDRSVNHHLIGN